MRYTIEFSKSLYEVDPNRVEGTLGQLGKLQSALGKLTDMASAKKVLKRAAVEAKADVRSVTRIAMAGNQERQKSKQLKKAGKALEKLERLGSFWT